MKNDSYGTRMWFGVGYKVRLEGLQEECFSVPDGAEVLQEEGKTVGFFVEEEGSIIMFPNGGDIVFYTGFATLIIKCAAIKEVEILAAGLLLNEKIFWRNYPTGEDDDDE